MIMEIDMKENLKWVWPMVKVYIIIMMVQNTKENMQMMKKMEMEYLQIKME